MLDKRFQTLIVLSKNLSYTKTANELFITQPAVYQQINSLENDLNMQLVITNKRQIVLTDAGRALARYAQQVQIESDKLITHLQNNHQDLNLKLGCTLSLSSTLLPSFISSLAHRSQLTASEIGNTTHILKNIRDGKVDFGLIEGNFNKEEFDSIEIKKEDFICVTNPETKVSAKNVADLFTQNLYVREPGSGSREILENWLSTQNYQLNDFQQVMEIASPTVIVQLLQQTNGVSFIYESLVTDAISQGKLKKLALQDFIISHPINLVF
ncbi:LysR family transcriptional regulator [Companilactobacillus furfuricola]|uniref:LysR family transcriptional regulator n=1 Tax=Companilactobacillus furfuricola TaxID=1462575 RepID=UPI001FE78ACA|nr:LysR family transcriptional regulator [Companilactobacillus furfuricola]